MPWEEEPADGRSKSKRSVSQPVRSGAGAGAAGAAAGAPFRPSISAGKSKAALRWRSVMHKDDEQLLAAGMDKRLVEALRVRREEHFHHVEGPVDAGRMTLKDRCAYAAPSLGTVPLTLLISVYGIQFYEVVVGADLLLIAMFLALARSLDVVTDPTMSYWTDSLRTEYGRRRPFLAIGCIPYGLCLIGLLTPPRSLDTTQVSVWFGVFYITFFLFTTFCNIPYDAMGPELTDNPEDRSRLFFLCTLYDGVGSLLAVLLPVILTGTVGSVRGDPDLSSCAVPVDGSITLRSCSTALSKSRAARIWMMEATAESYGLDEKVCDAARVVSNSSFAGTEALKSYCTCKDMCETANGDDTSRVAYSMTATFFAIWYAATMFNCVHTIKERSQMAGVTLPKPAPLVASSLRTFNNRPFNILLPAWVCDALVNSLISSLLTYFVRYIVEPEYSQTKCNNGLGSNLDWDCKSENVLGACVLALLMSAFLFSPVWLLMTKWIGKRNTWLLWSFMMALTNPLYFLVGPGDAMKCVVISGLNGIPFGAKFLADAILADVIDYDEFLTGNRAEATYTMFKSFLPKVAAIPASAIPVALLDVFGHISPIDGVIQQQTDPRLKGYLRATIIVIPTTLALLAFVLKLRFPIRTRSQNLAVSEGIGRHMVGSSATCPISKHDFTLIIPSNDTEITQFNRLDNFPGVTPIKHLLVREDGAQKLVTKTRLQFAFAVVFSFGSMFGVFNTWSLLETSGWCWSKNGVAVAALASESACVGSGQDNKWKAHSCSLEDVQIYAGDMSACVAVPSARWVEAPMNLSFFPVLFLVAFGVSITLIGVATGRLFTARTLKADPPDRKLLMKIKAIRTDRNATKDFATSSWLGFRDLMLQIGTPFRGTQFQQEAVQKVKRTMAERVLMSQAGRATSAAHGAGQAKDGGEGDGGDDESSYPGMVVPEDSNEGSIGMETTDAVEPLVPAATDGAPQP